METQAFTMLSDLIKFDMQQIQAYRHAVLDVSILTVGASLAISAFLFGKENTIQGRSRKELMNLANIGLLIILAIVGYHYIQGIDASRVCLDLREMALKAYIDKQQVITSTSLYPASLGHTPSTSSWLEKAPLLLAGSIIIANTLLENLFIANKPGRPSSH